MRAFLSSLLLLLSYTGRVCAFRPGAFVARPRQSGLGQRFAKTQFAVRNSQPSVMDARRMGLLVDVPSSDEFLMGKSSHTSERREPEVLLALSGVARMGEGLLRVLKRAGAPVVMAVGVLLLAATPSVSHASASIADLGVAASSSWNGVVAKLGASGFLQAFSLVFVSEIGDKTFFIAGLLAMKTSRMLSFTGSMAALSVMTVLSVLIGQLFHAIPPSLAGGFPFDDAVAALAFLYFGVKTLKDAYELPEGDMSGVEEERAEAEKAVEGSKAAEKQKSTLGQLLQIFSLVFAAEFGDRSFLSTIALGAAQNPISVATGAIGAHATATGIAVYSGAFLSKYFSEKIIGYIGGSLFVAFAFTTAFGVF